MALVILGPSCMLFKDGRTLTQILLPFFRDSFRFLRLPSMNDVRMNSCVMIEVRFLSFRSFVVLTCSSSEYMCSICHHITALCVLSVSSLLCVWKSLLLDRQRKREKLLAGIWPRNAFSTNAPSFRRQSVKTRSQRSSSFRNCSTAVSRWQMATAAMH